MTQDPNYSDLPTVPADYEVPEDATDLFCVPAVRMPYLENRITKLQRRQKRLAKNGPLADAAAITVEAIARQVRPPLCLCCGREHDGNHALDDNKCVPKPGFWGWVSGVGESGFWKPGPSRVYYVCRVTGPKAKLADWEFIATLQHEEAGTILRSVPGAEIKQGELDRLREVKPHCEHCKVRRNRKDSFVVRHTDGTSRQVGRTCLGKYIGGGADPKQIAKLAELLIAAREAGSCADEDDWGFGGPLYASIEDYLLFVAACVRVYGWLPRSKANEGDIATADEAWALLFPWSPKDKEAARAFVAKIEDCDAELATRALACARTELTRENTRSDYVHNLRVACVPDTVKGRTAGIVASVVTWYERRVARELRHKAARKSTRNSKHVGAVGDMVNVICTVMGVYDGESQWGFYHFHRFVDAVGNCLVWHSTSKRLEVGAHYELRGKIKEHSDYKGTLQTQLIRCRVIEKLKAVNG